MERGLKRKGGGVWQRQRKRVREEPGSSDAAAEASAKSKLARYLILQVLWGHISPNLAQTVASLAKEDLDVAREGGPTFRFVDLETLANLGASHTYDGSISKNAAILLHDGVQVALAAQPCHPVRRPTCSLAPRHVL